jgi:molybdenum cofactor cytidylyltransferase
VCDQPLLTSSHLRNLAAHYEKSKASVVSSGYGSTRGVPALFDQSMISHLLSLQDQEGAKQIILKNGNHVIEFEGGEIDLDTKANLESFLAHISNK